MMKKASVSLSVIVIVKNEVHNIKDCLNSVSWAKELLVVDDNSTDKTVAIAESCSAKVYQREMDVEGIQRNFAIDKVHEEWVLSLDADERVSDALASEIKEVVEKDDLKICGYAIPIKTFIGKRWIRGAGYYPATRLRLFRKGKLRYQEAAVHPGVLLEGKRAFLKGDIIHYGIKDLAQFVNKLNRQTTLEAQKWLLDGRRVSLLNSIRKTLDRFFRNYLRKGGIKDGFLGFIMSCFHGLYQLFAYAKYWEMKRFPEHY